MKKMIMVGLLCLCSSAFAGPKEQFGFIVINDRNDGHVVEYTALPVLEGQSHASITGDHLYTKGMCDSIRKQLPNSNCLPYQDQINQPFGTYDIYLSDQDNFPYTPVYITTLTTSPGKPYFTISCKSQSLDSCVIS